MDIGPVLVGLDGSEASGRALSYASGLCARSGLELLVVHVRRRPLPTAVGPMIAEDPVEITEDLECEAHNLAVEIMRDSPVRWRFMVRDGDPGEELQKATRELHASMLVISTRGAGVGARLHRIAEGSVSSWLLRHEQTPLLIVR